MIRPGSIATGGGRAAAAHGDQGQSGECREQGNAMRLQATYRGAEAQRFAFEPPPYGAGWPEVADEADVIFVYEKEPHEPGAHFHFLLAYDAEGHEVGRKRVAGRA
ncbi:MAG: hypothetical protein U9R72_10100 [Chloroflexota bacterium]|nr:hypothetical protein [Chloroflexota bacterium]